MGNAITSVLAQDGIASEAIVVDDASTDRTFAVACGHADARLRCLRQEVNGGPAAARNAALAVAQGRWIAVLDADDAMLPGRLARLLDVAETHGLDIVADNMWTEAADGTRRLFIPEDLDGTLEPSGFAAYVRRNRLFGPRAGDGYLKPVFRADFLRRHSLRYDATLRIGEDFMLMAEALLLGARYGRHRSAGYVYTVNVGSISHRLRMRDADAMIAADRRFLTRYDARLGHAERAAMRAHLRSLQDGACFTGMVEDIKAGNFLRLARRVGSHPAAVRHFAMPLRARLERAGLLARA